MASFLTRKILTPILARRVKRVVGWENVPVKTPYLIAANHVSFFDPPLIASLFYSRLGLKVHFLTKEYIWKFFGKFHLVKALGMIPIRSEAKADSLEEAVRFLEAGQVVAIFPEGTRNFGPELLQGKTGLARLALRTKLPVLPVGYSGPPSRTAWEIVRNFFKPSTEIKIEIGQPIQLNQFYGREVSKEALTEATRIIMKEIGRLCHKNYPY